MKILISGAGGFLGKELISQLIDIEQVFLIALTSQVSDLTNRFSEKNNILVLNRDAIINGEYQGDIDVFVNCAFPRNTDGSAMADGLKYISQMLQAAVERSVKGIINISSQSVYSQRRPEAADENYPLTLETPYAVGKYATELLTNSICASVPHTNLRMASLIGPGFNQRVTNKMAKYALETGKIHIKLGKQYFGFMDVRDAARGIKDIIFSDTLTWSEVYNLGSNYAYTLKDIALCIQKSLRRKEIADLEIECEEIDVIMNTALDCRKIEQEIGFSAVLSLQDSIDEIVDSFVYEE